MLGNCLRNFKESRFQLDLGFKQHKVFLVYLSRKELTARVLGVSQNGWASWKISLRKIGRNQGRLLQTQSDSGHRNTLVVRTLQLDVHHCLC